MKDYPPEFDDENLSNEYFKEAFPEYQSLAGLYKSAYDNIPCGPSISALVSNCDPIEHVDNSKWVHCDELRSLGSWEDMDKRGTLLLALRISSIVEGIEGSTETIEVAADQTDEEPRDFRERFWAAVDAVNAQAEALWDSTHGCDECARLWHQEDVFESEYGPFEGSDGATPVRADCWLCGGAGTSI